MNELYRSIKQIGIKYGAAKIMLFGSRARGDFRQRSDIDIAVFAMPTENQNRFIEEIENLPTLLDFDIIFVTDKTDPKLLYNIKNEGVIIMSKFDEKYSKYRDAVSRLKEAIDDFGKLGVSSVRDGAIQRFEFCTELAWKTTREYLIDMGYIDLNSPKEVMRTAFAAGLIDNDSAWIDILNSRNLTSHVYDEETAQKIFNDIKNIYIIQFETLISKLNK